MVQKVDSNSTGLRYAEETSVIKVLPGTPIWYPLEPNGYKDFGGQISTIARNPIGQSRSRKKGVTSDLDASGGFSQDLTTNNTTRLLQGFFFADAREKGTTAPLAGAAAVVTSVAGASKKYASTLMSTFKPNALVFASGFANAANNGFKTLTAASAGDITVAEVIVDEAAPPVTAKVEVVGFKFTSATASIVLNGTLARLSITGLDLTTLGFTPGEWIHLGGDVAGSTFAISKGFARISVIAAGYLELDKTEWTPVAESAAGVTLQIFTGLVLKNESTTAMIKRRTYNVERTLGSDDDGVMSEYLVGAVANELTLNVAMADKVTMDLSFVAVDNEQRKGITGVKPGVRPTLAPANAFNTSSDFARIKLASVSATNSAPVPLFAFATELTLTVNNNVNPNKALGVLGAFDTSAGTFEVGGKLTAYFANVDSVAAVRNNADITMDVILVKENAGLMFDIPLLSLGDGRLTIEQDQPIMVPLENMAAESKFGHTLLFQSFAYLPNLAM